MRLRPPAPPVLEDDMADAADLNALTRAEVATQYFAELGCDNPAQAQTKLVSMAARRNGPPYFKIGGISAPALYDKDQLARWLAARQ